MLSVKDLSLSYNQESFVLDDISFELGSGQILAVLGPNGVGKTSLIRIISTLIYPTSGEVKVDCNCTVNESHKVRQAIGYMPSSENNFFPRFTGLENLKMFAQFQGASSFESCLEDWKKIEVLSKALTTQYYLCSSGMKQLLSLCRTLLHTPKLVLLDEPSRSVDKNGKSVMIEILKKYVSEDRENRSILFTTHETDFSDNLATKYLNLERGKIVNSNL